jgi:hypothetical protein
VVEKLAGLAIVVACCWWAASVERSRAADNWLIWGAPLAVFPVSYAGRKALDARPTAAHAAHMNIWVHYAVGAALGVGIFPAFRRLLAEPVIRTPWLRHAAGALVVVTAAAAALTVVNLAWRGLGAPFAVKAREVHPADLMRPLRFSIRKAVAESHRIEEKALGAQVRQVGCMLDNALRSQHQALCQWQRLCGAFCKHSGQFLGLTEVGSH